MAIDEWQQLTVKTSSRLAGLPTHAQVPLNSCHFSKFASELGNF